MFDEVALKVEGIIKPFIEGSFLDLVEIQVRPSNQTMMIQILADRPQGGITVDECAAINRYLDNEIIRQNLLEDYTIEVSSPGLDRPLLTAKDFLRVKGCDVRFHLLEPINNKLEHSGVVYDIQESCVVIKSASGMLTVPLEKISKAMQII